MGYPTVDGQRQSPRGSAKQKITVGEVPRGESVGKNREKDESEDHGEVLDDEPRDRDASLLRLNQSSFPQCPQNDNRTCNR